LISTASKCLIPTFDVGLTMATSDGRTDKRAAVSQKEATIALETLANLLFLASQSAADATKVRAYMGGSGECISKLKEFIRQQNPTTH
jgi:hypothetical protein